MAGHRGDRRGGKRPYEEGHNEERRDGEGEAASDSGATNSLAERLAAEQERENEAAMLERRAAKTLYPYSEDSRDAQGTLSST